MTETAFSPHRFCVAPMIDWTDRHCRFFHRRLTRRARLYTEMIVDEAILRGDRDRLLGFDPDEHPVAIQLGGSDAAKLAEAARIAEGYGYDEINLNVGCPSDRVQSGTFGACLMKEPQTVARAVAAMQAAVSAPVTVKSRIGVDDQEARDSLFSFVRTVADAGCGTFIVHARKAWLQGLSPKENREIPPLDYGLVAELKASRPDLQIILNGGITSIDACKEHLRTFDGVMLGRAAYERPALLGEADAALFADPARVSPSAAAEAMIPYLERHVAGGGRPHQATRHMLGLFHGRPGARGWRRMLSVEATKPGADASILRRALDAMPPAALDEAA
ncbi:MAG: tRNA dihydrouridine(20/20a) synthase DusA [Pseudomonadota bacterium]